MAGDSLDPRVFHLFADLLDYPRANPAEAARECATRVAPRSPEAAALLREFAAFAGDTPLGRQQEIYTANFELDAACHPYVGYHLFGESYKRSAFLLGLKERYRAYHLDPGTELPDHLAVVTRFLSLNTDEGQAADLVVEALLPTLEKMLRKSHEGESDGDGEDVAAEDDEPSRNVHGLVLDALRRVLLTLPIAASRPAPVVAEAWPLPGDTPHA